MLAPPVFVDRNRFDADPDPTFHFDADPGPDPDPTFVLSTHKRSKLNILVQDGRYRFLFHVVVDSVQTVATHANKSTVDTTP